MKLFLTSAGLTNQSIADALIKLVGKPAEDISIAFIPTAAHAEKGDKGWLVADIRQIWQQGFKSFETADISLPNKDVWMKMIQDADVIWVNGGNTYFLMEWMNRSGLASALGKLIQTKVYAGSSAGSMVTCKDLALKASQLLYGEDLERAEDMPALDWVPFYFLPHFNSTYFTKVTEKAIREEFEGKDVEVYALDDQSAMTYVDGKIEVISEGEWLHIPKNP